MTEVCTSATTKATAGLLGRGHGGTGPCDVYGLQLEPLVDGLKDIAEQLLRA